jgi:phospholipase/carboxylesterase
MKKVILYFLFVLSGLVYGQKVSTSLTYVVNEPAKRTNKTPVLIMLHGYGANESDLFDIAKTFDTRFITFSLRAPIEIQGESFCWFNLIRHEGMPFTYDYKEVKEASQKVLSFISNACKAYHVDSTQVFLMGFSQGAMLSYDLALNAPKKIKGVAALSGKMMEEDKTLKTNWDQATKVKFFIGHGKSDNTIKMEEANKAIQFLKSKNVIDVTYKQYEMPHTISGDELNDMRAWLVKVISPEKKVQAKK